MRKQYRGWTLIFLRGSYTATKKGYTPLTALTRVDIERAIDNREWVDVRKTALAEISRMNRFIGKLKDIQVLVKSFHGNGNTASGHPTCCETHHPIPCECRH